MVIGGEDEVAGLELAQGLFGDGFLLGYHYVPRRVAGRYRHSLRARLGGLKRDGYLADVQPFEHLQHVRQGRSGIELAARLAQGAAVGRRQGLQQGADDFHALDRVDTEVGLQVLLQADHVARVAGALLDDGQQDVLDLAAIYLGRRGRYRCNHRGRRGNGCCSHRHRRWSSCNNRSWRGNRSRNGSRSHASGRRGDDRATRRRCSGRHAARHGSRHSAAGHKGVEHALLGFQELAHGGEVFRHHR